MSACSMSCLAALPHPILLPPLRLSQPPNQRDPVRPDVDDDLIPITLLTPSLSPHISLLHMQHSRLGQKGMECGGAAERGCGARQGRGFITDSAETMGSSWNWRMRANCAHHGRQWSISSILGCPLELCGLAEQTPHSHSTEFSTSQMQGRELNSPWLEGVDLLRLCVFV
jgi:hypothetical protein